jgi:hypothetical protein
MQPSNVKSLNIKQVGVYFFILICLGFELQWSQMEFLRLDFINIPLTFLLLFYWYFFGVHNLYKVFCLLLLCIVDCVNSLPIGVSGFGFFIATFFINLITNPSRKYNKSNAKSLYKSLDFNLFILFTVLYEVFKVILMLILGIKKTLLIFFAKELICALIFGYFVFKACDLIKFILFSRSLKLNS